MLWLVVSSLEIYEQLAEDRDETALPRCRRDKLGNQSHLSQMLLD